jgi:hypothetical protein
VNAKLLDEFLHFHADSPISFHTFTGKQMEPSFGKVNLLDAIMQRERFVCDTNSFWKEESGKSSNQSKVFIIPHTTLDENDDVHGNIFGKKVDSKYRNIFFFSALPPQVGLGLAIERYDSQFIKRFSPDKFRQASRERLNKSDANYLKAERERMTQVLEQKKKILSLVELENVENLPPAAVTERRKSGAIRYVRREALKCFSDYSRSMNLAAICYAALLLERDAIGEKTRKEFSDQNRRNVFGDVLLFRDALWFKSRILSNDRAIVRMSEYVATMPEIKVTGII